jgi:hypothetical protein
MGLFSSNKSTTTNQTTQNFYDQRSVIDAGGGVVGDGNFVDASSVTDNRQSFVDASASFADNSSRYSFADNSARFTDNSSRDQSFRFADNSSRYAYTDDSVSLTDSSSRNSWADSSVRNAFSQNLSDDRDSFFADSSNRAVTNYSAVTNTQAVDPGLVRLAELNSAFLSTAAGAQSDTVKLMVDGGYELLGRAGGSATDLFSRSAANSAAAWESTLDHSSALLASVLDGVGQFSRQSSQLATAAISSYQPAESKTADVMKWAGMAVAALVVLMLLRGKA